MNFTKSERICSLRVINELLEKGKSFYAPPFKVVYLFKAREFKNNGTGASSITSNSVSTPAIPFTVENNDVVASIMISVPKRNFKKAVKRNLIKRRIRESYRLNKDLLLSSNSITEKKLNFMLFYSSKEILTFAEIEKAVRKILQILAKTDKSTTATE